MWLSTRSGTDCKYVVFLGLLLLLIHFLWLLVPFYPQRVWFIRGESVKKANCKPRRTLLCFVTSSLIYIFLFLRSAQKEPKNSNIPRIVESLKGEVIKQISAGADHSLAANFGFKSKHRSVLFGSSLVG
jgi:hypothetical protein